MGGRLEGRGGLEWAGKGKGNGTETEANTTDQPAGHRDHINQVPTKQLAQRNLHLLTLCLSPPYLLCLHTSSTFCPSINEEEGKMEVQWNGKEWRSWRGRWEEEDVWEGETWKLMDERNERTEKGGKGKMCKEKWERTKLAKKTKKKCK